MKHKFTCFPTVTLYIKITLKLNNTYQTDENYLNSNAENESHSVIDLQIQVSENIHENCVIGTAFY